MMIKFAAGAACGVLGLAGLGVLGAAAYGAASKAPKPVVAAAPRSTETPPEISEAYQQLDTNLEQQNTSAVLGFYTPNAVFYDTSGRVHPLSEVAPEIAESIKGSQSIASSTTIEAALVQSDGTTVTIKQHMIETRIDPKTGILNNLDMSFTGRDHWIQVNGRWKINRTRLLSTFSQMNGKPATAGR